MFGKTKAGTQRYRCLDCEKTFTAENDSPLGVMRLEMDKANAVLHHLLEGCSVRGTERITCVQKRTILALMVHVAQNCQRMLEAKLANVYINDLQCDEIWSFVRMKEKTREALNRSEEFGDAYCFVGIERSTKLVVCWHLGKRTPEDTERFAHMLRRATTGRFQCSTDGWGPYRTTIPETFGDRVDFMQVIKQYGLDGVDSARKYSPAKVTGINYEIISGSPTQARACTSHVERNNVSIRMASGRWTRLTNGFSKKLANHEAALGLSFAYYNFGR